MAINKAKYDLSGGSIVEVHKVFGDEYYIALVEMAGGRYPDEGSIAKDINRSEYIIITKGSFTININGTDTILNKNESILINDGDSYYLTGLGEAIVFVKDGENGETKIIKS